MSIYVDTSILVSALFDEPKSSQVRSWWKSVAKKIIASEFVAVECAAVISRAFRMGELSDRDAAAALRDLDAVRAEIVIRFNSPRDFQVAELLVRDFATKLAAPDALHLATAMNAGAAIATFDNRLADAARSRRVEVVEIA